MTTAGDPVWRDPPDVVEISGLRFERGLAQLDDVEEAIRTQAVTMRRADPEKRILEEERIVRAVGFLGFGDDTVGLVRKLFQPGAQVIQLRRSSTSEPPPHEDSDFDPRDATAMVDDVRSSKVTDLSVVAPTFAELYGADHLAADEARELVSLESLPPWPGAREITYCPDTDVARDVLVGHGIGPELDQRIGGGIHPGMSIGIAASAAGAGKTAFAMQIADGLALRTLELIETGAPGPLTPVLVVTEMGLPPLTWRTLARWTGLNNQVFRAGKSAPRLLGWRPERVAAAFDEGRNAMRGTLGRARQFERLHNTSASGVKLVDLLAAAVNTWRAELAVQFPNRAIWPVVVLDPIQRWADVAKSEVEGLNELVQAIRDRVVDDQWIAILTSDTNKPAATGKTADDARDPQQEGTAAFRGSYKLLHILDVALYLRKPPQGVQAHGETQPPDVLAAARHDQIEAVPVKLRFGHTVEPYPTFRWERHTGRIEPIIRSDKAAAKVDKTTVATSEKHAKSQARRDAVRAAIVDHPGISRNGIAEVTGLSPNTVSSILEVFQLEHVIRRAPEANSGKGGLEWIE